MIRSSIIIGGLVKLLRLLRSALAEVVSGVMPQLHDAVKQLHQAAPVNSGGQGTADTRSQPLDFAAMDCGLEVGSADHNIRNAVRVRRRQRVPSCVLTRSQRFKTAPTDEVGFSFLPGCAARHRADLGPG